MLLPAVVLTGQAVDTTALVLPSVQACPGDTLHLPITVRNFEGVRALQFLLEWDAAQLTYLDSCNSFDPNLRLFSTASNRLWFTFFDLNYNPNAPNTLADGDTLVMLKFLVNDLTTPANIAFNSVPPDFVSQITINATPSNVTFSPHTTNGLVEYLDLMLTADSRAIRCDSLGRLSGSSPVENVSYHWYTPSGHAYSSLSDTVASQSGLYQLVGAIGACRDSVTVDLIFDTLPPALPLLLDDSLRCSNPLVNLTPADIRPEINYTWVTPRGDSIPSASLSADTAGLYTLLITQISNACSAMGSLMLYDATEPPVFSLGGSGDITCSANSVVRFADYADDLDLSLLWQNSEGLLLSNTDSLRVSQPGTYVAIATDNQTACVAMDSFTVSRIDTVAAFTPQADGILNCDQTTIALSVDTVYASSGYIWLNSTADTIARTAQTDVSQAGQYTLVVVDSLSGCTGQQTIEVTQNIREPVSDLSVDGVLNCRTSAVTLEVVNISPNTTYRWENEAGMPIMGNTVNLSGRYYLYMRDTLNACLGVDSVFVEQNYELPDILISFPQGDSVLTCITQQIELLAQSNLTAVEYVWQNTAFDTLSTSPNVVVNTAASFRLSILNTLNACVADTLLTIDSDYRPPVYTLNQTEATLSCDGEAILFTAAATTDEVSFTWLDGLGNIMEASDSVLLNQAGNYYLVALNQESNCMDTTAITLIQANAPTVSVQVSNLINCRADTALLQVDTLIPSLTYTWFDSQGNEVGSNPWLVVDQTGDYRLRVRDTITNCTAEVEARVAANFDFPDGLAVSPPPLDCQRTFVDLAVDGLGASVIFSWLDSNGLPLNSPRVNQAGSYYLLLTDTLSACSRSDSITLIADLELPEITLNTPSDLFLTCSQSSLSLSAASSEELSYLWSQNNGEDTLSQSAVLEVNAPGIYQLTATLNRNACSRDTFLSVVENRSLPTANISILAFDCSRQQTTLTTTTDPNYTYRWQGPGVDTESANEAMLTVDSIGLFQLVVTDRSNGCSATTSIELTGDESSIQEISFMLRPVSCSGSSNDGSLTVLGSLGGTPPYTYTLNNQNIGEEGVFTNLSAGEYLLSVTDANACTLDTLFDLSEATGHNVSIETNTTEIILGDSTQLRTQFDIDTSAIQHIRWSDANGLIVEDQPTIWVSPLNTTRYQIISTDENGCTSESSILILVDKKVKYYAPNAFSPNFDGINDYFVIERGPGIRNITQLDIYDRWGNHIFSTANPERGWDGNHKGQPAAVGMYIYRASLLLANDTVEVIGGDISLFR